MVSKDHETEIHVDVQTNQDDSWQVKVNKGPTWKTVLVKILRILLMILKGKKSRHHRSDD